MDESKLTERQALNLLRAAGYTVTSRRGVFTVTDPQRNPHVLDRLGLFAYTRRVQANLAPQPLEPPPTGTARNPAPAAPAEITPAGTTPNPAPAVPIVPAPAVPPASPASPDAQVVATRSDGQATSVPLSPVPSTETHAADPSPTATTTLPRRGTDPIIVTAPVLTPTHTLAAITTLLDDHAQTLRTTAQRQGASFTDPTHVFPMPAGLLPQFAVHPSLVVPGRFQPRTTFADAPMRELMANIAELGIINRLLVFANEHGQLELVGGERRLRAARMLALPAVPVELFAGTLRQIALASTSDNLQRTDLTPIEEGGIYERLIVELQITEAELARQLGRPRTTIQQRRMLVKAATDLREALLTGEISFTQARAILQAAPGDHQSQQSTLTALRARFAAGQRVTEDDARALTETEILKGAEPRLAHLGWQIIPTSGASPLVWAITERPARWSGLTILTALRDKRRPSSGDPPPTLTLPREALDLVTARGYRLETRSCAPWVGVSLGETPPDRFLTWTEVRDNLLPHARADIAALSQQIAAHGWQLTLDQGTLRFMHPSGDHRTMLNWEHAQRTAQALTVSPSPSTTPQRNAPRQPCTDGIACGKQHFPSSELSFFDGQQRCHGCITARQALAQAQQDRLRQHLTVIAGPWLAAIPEPVLPLLIAGCLNHAPRLGYHHLQSPATKVTIISQQSRVALLDAAVDLLASIAWKYRDTPLALTNLVTDEAAEHHAVSQPTDEATEHHAVPQLTDEAATTPDLAAPPPPTVSSFAKRLHDLHARLNDAQELTTSDMHQIIADLAHLRAEMRAAKAEASAAASAEFDRLDRESAATSTSLHAWLLRTQAMTKESTGGA